MGQSKGDNPFFRIIFYGTRSRRSTNKGDVFSAVSCLNDNIFDLFGQGLDVSSAGQNAGRVFLNAAAGAEIEVIFRVAVDRVLSSFRKNIQNLTLGAVFEHRGTGAGN